MNCKDCRHFLDLRPHTPTADMACGPMVCQAPELRDFLGVEYEQGKRQQNSLINADACRDVSALCGHAARWFK